MSQITTHVLNTMTGKPAERIKIILERNVAGNDWAEISSGTTNRDGRISDLLDENQFLGKGVYRIIFQTNEYFDRLNLKCFYPEVPIVFEIIDKSHYHIPLLLSPFGYSTYRGS